MNNINLEKKGIVKICHFEINKYEVQISNTIDKSKDLNQYKL